MAGAPNIDVQTVAQLPFREAADAMASRVPVLTPSVLDSAREFWLSQRAVAAAPIRKTLTKMAQDYLERYLSAGGESNQGFTDWLADSHPGITRGYAETVRRAALGNSYSAGRVKQMREHNQRVEALVGAPDIVGFRLLSAGDAAVRPEHAALDGIAFPLNERGLRFMPPNGFGCRCDTAPVFADENAQLASDAEMAALERFVDDGWLNAPSSIMEDRASLASRAGRVKLAEGDGTRWITIGGGGVDDETGEPTGGGRRVQIDGEGRIVKGLSKNAEGKTLDEAFSDTEATFGKGSGEGSKASTPEPDLSHLTEAGQKMVRDSNAEAERAKVIVRDVIRKDGKVVGYKIADEERNGVGAIPAEMLREYDTGGNGWWGTIGAKALENQRSQESKMRDKRQAEAAADAAAAMEKQKRDAASSKKRVDVSVVKETAKAALIKDEQGREGWVQKRWLKDGHVSESVLEKAVASNEERKRSYERQRAWKNTPQPATREPDRETAKAIGYQLEVEIPSSASSLQGYTTKRMAWFPKSQAKKIDGKWAIPGWLIDARENDIAQEVAEPYQSDTRFMDVFGDLFDRDAQLSASLEERVILQAMHETISLAPDDGKYLKNMREVVDTPED